MGLFSSIASNIVEAIDDLLADTGDWARSILDAGAHIYNKFVDVAYSIVTKDIHDPAFQDFWNVVDNVNAVIVTVSSVLLVMMFLYTLIQTSLQPRQEIDTKSLIAEFIKLLFCNLLITQAVNIVTGIFTFGTRLARLAVSSGDGKITDPNRGVSEAVAFSLDEGVSGISGLLIVILSLIGAIVMVACAIMIVLEIYKRFFRIFVLIPFASISFSTSVMADGHGNEVFRGYLKSMIAASFESVIIVLCLVFCSALTAPKGDEYSQSSFMQTLFTFTADDNSVHTIEFSDQESYDDFKTYARTMCYFTGSDDEKQDLMDMYDYKELGIFDMYRTVYKNGFTRTDNKTDNNLVNLYRSTFDLYDPVFPVTVVTGRRISLGGGLILILQVIFPMVLTAGAIKEAPVYASKIIGN